MIESHKSTCVHTVMEDIFLLVFLHFLPLQISLKVLANFALEKEHAHPGWYCKESNRIPAKSDLMAHNEKFCIKAARGCQFYWWLFDYSNHPNVPRDYGMEIYLLEHNSGEHELNESMYCYLDLILVGGKMKTKVCAGIGLALNVMKTFFQCVIFFGIAVFCTCLFRRQFLLWKKNTVS